MKIILNKIQILSEVIESPQLNVVDCKLITESTIKLLEKMNEDTIALNNEISSAKSFSEKLGIDPENDFKKNIIEGVLFLKGMTRKIMKSQI